ncbi:glutathione S-transferase family protein [Ferrovibrio sp.]|uniref:glutathione S-transferase family protein n=1 Tax=Ferrovibrio sp. TaxID=1917215 RepID=UPI003D0B852C
MAAMAPIRLYSGPLSMYGAKAQIAAAEKGLALDLVMVPFDMTRLYEPKHPDVLRINPKAQVPVLIHGDLEIFDSTQIFEYLEDIAPEPPLWPNDVQQRARARLLEHRSDEIYFPHIIRLMGLQQTPEDPAAITARQAATVFYDAMENQIAGQDYLTGVFGYADIAFFMAQLFGERMGAPLEGRHARLIAWRERMLKRPSVRQVAAPMVTYLSGQGRKLPAFLHSLQPPPRAL